MVSQRFPRYVMNVSYRSLLTGFFNSGNGNKYLGAIYWQINCLWTKTLEKEAMSKFMHFFGKIPLYYFQNVRKYSAKRFSDIITSLIDK